MVKIGDKVIVNGLTIKATVTKVWYDAETDRDVIELDWGKHGTSKVYGHEENTVWYTYSTAN